MNQMDNSKKHVTGNYRYTTPILLHPSLKWFRSSIAYFVSSTTLNVNKSCIMTGRLCKMRKRYLNNSTKPWTSMCQPAQTRPTYKRLLFLGSVNVYYHHAFSKAIPYVLWNYKKEEYYYHTKDCTPTAGQFYFS